MKLMLEKGFKTAPAVRHLGYMNEQDQNSGPNTQKLASTRLKPRKETMVQCEFQMKDKGFLISYVDGNPSAAIDQIIRNPMETFRVFL